MWLPDDLYVPASHLYTFQKLVRFRIFSFLTHVAKNSCCEALVGCVFRSQNWAAKAVASAVRMACSLWEHAGGCEREVRGFFACRAHPETPAPTLHPQSEPFCASKAFVVRLGKQQPVA